MEKNKSTSLKEIRKAKGLSRRQVAEQSGTNMRSLQDYEQGHKDIRSAKADTLYRLSRTLDCAMEDLLGDGREHVDVTGVSNVKRSSVHRLAAYRAGMDEKNSVLWNDREKQEQDYYLMHQNNRAALLTFDRMTGKILRVKKIFQKELVPPGANLSVTDMKKWWDRRAVPLNQGNMKQILEKCHVPTAQNYLLQNLGLSLSDHYWVNPTERGYLWEEVNLFTNDFRDELGEFEFQDSFSNSGGMLNLYHRTLFYPSASQQGELQKKWVIQDGKRYLVKGYYGESAQQSVNERIACLLHEKQGQMPYTRYELCEVRTSKKQGIGCICKDFCTESVEFISAYDVVCSVKKKNEDSQYEHFIKVCVEHGLSEEDVRGFLEYQILTDFVLTNTDRHLYNFGVLRDTKTLKYLGMAPIFDSGNSLFWDVQIIPKEEELLKLPANSFCKREVEHLKYVKVPERVCIEKLPSEEELYKLLSLAVSEERCLEIIGGYRAKKELLKLFQQGEKLYRYNFTFKNSRFGV